MNFIKYAAWVALAMVPLMLLKKKVDVLSQDGREVDSDEIFELELSDR
jgi:hypothetical protein